MEFKGRVLRVLEKHGRSAKGPWTLYNIVLETSSGEVVLGCGFDKPNAPTGAVISIEAEENNKGYLDADLSTLKVHKDEGRQAASNKSVGDGVAAMDKRQRSIVTQTSYKIAADAVESMLAHGLIKIPAAKSATNDSFETYMQVLDATAQAIFNKCIEGLNPEEEQEETTEEGEYDPLA